MKARRGSVRDCLWRVEQLSLSNNLNPSSRYWKFRRERHEQSIDQLIAKLRVLASDLEFAVHGEIDGQE